ncbi:MAG: cytochrome b/b6 domain-containing protein [Dehalococcoidia bacterium]|nr:cytochrome b/b6 domain-containing protein [Dehalococcoidia bacterium]
MAQAQAKIPPRPLSLRVLHEALMAAILLLIVTGFYIHRPFVADGGGFLMSLMRGVHFFAAAVLIVVAVLRIIRMFVGPNKDWQSFIPTGADLKLFLRFVNYYARVATKPQIEKRYNPFQMLSYILVFLLVIFQIITGFTLLYPDGWLRFISYGIFNNEINVRVAHLILTWIFLLFLMIHVYLGIRESFQEMKGMHLLSDTEEK